MKRHTLPPAVASIALIALIAFAFAFQGSRGLWEPDEGRYTNIATQMLRSHNFVEPAWNDDFSHFAKPPLSYWAVAGGVTLLGWNEWGARAPNAVAFALTVLLVLALGRRVTPGRPWLAALVYALTLLPYGAANIITTDTLLTLWETTAMLGFLRWHQAGRERAAWRWLLLMWGGFGLAFLTKGPPGLLPLLAVVVFLGLVEGRGSVRRLFDPRGLLTFVLVGFSWYAVVLVRRPELLRYFLQDEVVGRIASGQHRRNAAWYGAFTTYVPAFLVGFLPWTAFLFRPLRRAGNLLRAAWWRAEARERPMRLLALLWAIVPLAVFALSQSRLPLYVLPLFVPLALLLAQRWETTRIPGRAAGWALAAWCLLLVGGRWAASTVASPQDSRPLALAIAALPGEIPSEIVFVDDRPSWALSLYLGAEVELVYLRRPWTSEAESFEEELLEHEPHLLYIVRGRQEPRFARLAEARGLDVERVGGLGDRGFFRLHAAATAQQDEAASSLPPS
ncbi:MAG: glycosyltransferase family 39 protein [Acidobacteria bacterium]|nr:glycosyltransferase family 39 protein [Acidobacteriota bacterium]